jgi:EAL domain-containing protein (putative c-di-GMP-specific phosphodiesterase class I)
MHDAKDRGRNTYRFYNQSMNATAHQRLTMENHLRRALDRDELLLHYQPKIDASSGRIVGAEALLRWKHPELGLVSPAQFIPLAEETGLIKPIGEWVLATACRQNRQWQDAGHAALPISVNMSAANFRAGNLPELVDRALAASRLAPGLLELEMTESLLMHNVEETTELLHRLKAAGVRLSIDDFGTGYSSLSYLKRFPLDVLKIDRSFVTDVATNPGDKAITSAIVALARSLDLGVVAEGVETLVQADLLQSLGCHVMQGFYYSRPVAPAEFETLLATRGGTILRVSSAPTREPEPLIHVAA